MISVKAYLRVSGGIFFIVGFLHFLRLFTHWTILLGGWDVSLWVSLLGVIVAWSLSYVAFLLAEKSRKKGRR